MPNTALNASRTYPALCSTARHLLDVIASCARTCWTLNSLDGSDHRMGRGIIHTGHSGYDAARALQTGAIHQLCGLIDEVHPDTASEVADLLSRSLLDTGEDTPDGIWHDFVAIAADRLLTNDDYRRLWILDRLGLMSESWTPIGGFVITDPTEDHGIGLCTSADLAMSIDDPEDVDTHPITGRRDRRVLWF